MATLTNEIEYIATLEKPGEQPKSLDVREITESGTSRSRTITVFMEDGSSLELKAIYRQ